MAFKVVDPTIHKLPLDECDPSGETYVEFREATFDEDRRHADYWAESKHELDDENRGKITIYQRVSRGEIELLDVWLTLVSCNIRDADDALLLKSRAEMDYETFCTRAGKLPTKVWRELYNRCIMVNPDWGFGVRADATR